MAERRREAEPQRRDPLSIDAGRATIPLFDVERLRFLSALSLRLALRRCERSLRIARFLLLIVTDTGAPLAFAASL
jgi:hypothetical protein